MHLMSKRSANPDSKARPRSNGKPMPRSDDMPSLDHLITDDGKPVDSFFVEKQQRLLTEPLNSSWAGPGGGQPFVAASNVGLFFEPINPAFCPDAMLSVGVRLGDDLSLKQNRSYFVWLLGKVPDVAIEIVSDKRGSEAGYKMLEYARHGIPYYVIFDPKERLRAGVLRVLACRQGVYELMPEAWFGSVGLGMRLWQGVYEDHAAEWLRWCERDGTVIPSGKEKIEQEAQRAEQEKQRAKQAKQRTKQHKQRAEQEKQRADQLRAQLRALGIDPSA
jgi:Uma2 family endonuclease